MKDKKQVKVLREIKKDEQISLAHPSSFSRAGIMIARLGGNEAACIENILVNFRRLKSAL